MLHRDPGRALQARGEGRPASASAGPTRNAKRCVMRSDSYSAAPSTTPRPPACTRAHRPGREPPPRTALRGDGTLGGGGGRLSGVNVQELHSADCRVGLRSPPDVTLRESHLQKPLGSGSSAPSGRWFHMVKTGGPERSRTGPLETAARALSHPAEARGAEVPSTEAGHVSLSSQPQRHAALGRASRLSGRLGPGMEDAPVFDVGGGLDRNCIKPQKPHQARGDALATSTRGADAQPGGRGGGRGPRLRWRGSRDGEIVLWAGSPHQRRAQK